LSPISAGAHHQRLKANLSYLKGERNTKMKAALSFLRKSDYEGLEMKNPAGWRGFIDGSEG
jgi:hypothetical protein